jgi:hypothetical protein
MRGAIKVFLAVLAYAGEHRARISAAAILFFLATLFLSVSASAQEQGPLQGAAPQEEDYPSIPAPRRDSPPPRQVHQAPPQQSPAPRPASSEGLSKDQPSVPVDQIIEKFAAREQEFKEERDNFTYVQDFVIQTISDSGRPDGEFHQTTDITFPDGKRDEHVTYAPQSTLERILLSKQDMDDLRDVQPFVLTTAELPKYDVTYVGREKVDEISCYVFDVGPKRLEKNQRYFQGRIWVDDSDMEIVKTYGKAVPDIHKGNNENVFPRFETYRENIEGNYWFPTYTHADDVLHFRTEDVRIRMTVRYTDYKRFRVSIKLLKTEPVSEPNAAPPPPPKP